MAIHFAGQTFSKIYMAGVEIAKAIIAGTEHFSKVAGPTHTTNMSVGNNGFNGILGRGSMVDATYDTPGGKSVTIIHCRRVSAELNFALRAASGVLVAADFPTRIVATKQTGGVVERTLVPQSGSLRRLGSTGSDYRQDYDPESGAVADVLVNGQTVQIQLYY